MFTVILLNQLQHASKKEHSFTHLKFELSDKNKQKITLLQTIAWGMGGEV